MTPGDVRRVAPAVLCQRLFPRDAAAGTEAARAILEKVLDTVPAPL